MATLKENMEAIQLEKDTKVLPGNIKKNVTMFGVVGTLEATSGGGEGIKHFTSIEEMNLYEGTPNEKCIVLGSVYKPYTVEDRFRIRRVLCPATVVLDSAITTNTTKSGTHYYYTLRKTMFQIRNATSPTKTVRYTSTDGITYTRSDTLGEVVDFGEYLDIDEASWNTNLEKFLINTNDVFEGLFQGWDETDPDTISLPLATNISVFADKKINRVKLISTANKFIEGIGGLPDGTYFRFFLDNADEVCAIVTSGDTKAGGLYTESTDSTYLGVTASTYWVEALTSPTITLYKLDLENETYTKVGTYTCNKYIERTGDTTLYHEYTTAINAKTIITGMTVSANVIADTAKPSSYYFGNSAGDGLGGFKPLQDFIYVWHTLVTQFDAAAENVAEGRLFFGRNGVEVGTYVEPTTE